MRLCQPSKDSSTGSGAAQPNVNVIKLLSVIKDRQSQQIELTAFGTRTSKNVGVLTLKSVVRQCGNEKKAHKRPMHLCRCSWAPYLVQWGIYVIASYVQFCRAK